MTSIKPCPTAEQNLQSCSIGKHDHKLSAPLQHTLKPVLPEKKIPHHTQLLNIDSRPAWPGDRSESKVFRSPSYSTTLAGNQASSHAHLLSTATGRIKPGTWTVILGSHRTPSVWHCPSLKPSLQPCLAAEYSLWLHQGRDQEFSAMYLKTQIQSDIEYSNIDNTEIWSIEN